MTKRGFTLIELSVSLGILSLMASGAIFVMSLVADSARQSETIAKVTMLARAIVGDSRIVTKESRTDFGYVGDMGSLPPSLSDLWIRGAKPAYSYDNAKKTGAGWAGPYLPAVGPLEYSNQLVLDSWGNEITYSIGTGTSGTTGQQYRARIISAGPDAAVGSADDITAEIYATEVFSSVVSYIRDSSGNPMPNIQVKMNYPVGGALTTSTVFSGADGSYLFTEIPFGNRSITVEPKLVYSEGSGVSLNGDDVEFVMLSFTCGTITGATATLGDEPTPYFQQFRVGGTTVFNNTTDLAGDGQFIDFTTDPDISWSGCGGGGTGLANIFPVRVQSPFTQVPDQDIGAGASAGRSFRMRMNNFRLNENGTGGAVDMTGISISVTFAPINAVAIFSPVPN